MEQRRIGMEPLEERAMLAVTASFSAQFGQLTITGDQADNVINVSRATNGDILINNGEVAVTGGDAQRSEYQYDSCLGAGWQ